MAKILTMAPPRRPYIVVVEYEASNVAFVVKIAPLLGRSGPVDHHYFKHYADLVSALEVLGISHAMLAGTGSSLAQRGRCIFDNVLLDTRKVEHLKTDKSEPLAALD
jgi:hypothetical protein